MTEEKSNITPLDIMKKQFSTAFRGFDAKEVEAFLGIITAELEDLIKKNEDLRNKLEKKKQEFNEIKEREASMRKTLEGLQQILNEERGRAEEKGKHIIREAELKASEMVLKAKEEQSTLQNEIGQIKRMRREFLAKLGSLVNSYKKIIEEDQVILDQEIRIAGNDVQII